MDGRNYGSNGHYSDQPSSSSWGVPHSRSAERHVPVDFRDFPSSSSGFNRSPPREAGNTFKEVELLALSFDKIQVSLDLKLGSTSF